MSNRPALLAQIVDQPLWLGMLVFILVVIVLPATGIAWLRSIVLRRRLKSPELLLIVAYWVVLIGFVIYVLQPTP